MKAERLNLCTSIRLSLISAGISTVRVVNAVNAELGKLTHVSEDSKLGDGRAMLKKGKYSVRESVSNKYEGKLTTPLRFDAWNSAIAKAEKIASFDSIAIPGEFAEWLGKFKAAPAAQSEPTEAPAPAEPAPEPVEAQ